jgi:hypothetical protein
VFCAEALLLSGGGYAGAGGEKTVLNAVFLADLSR